jgi:hypothetical protein
MGEMGLGGVLRGSNCLVGERDRDGGNHGGRRHQEEKGVEETASDCRRRLMDATQHVLAQ